ncbi:MAG: hypothetical protein P4L75_00340, partial [Clostridia bacterium]|nr:hypothetical protein [Clostridia bacterium]
YGGNVMKWTKSVKTFATVCTTLAVILFISGCNSAQNKTGDSTPATFSGSTLSATESRIQSPARDSSSPPTYTQYHLNMDFLSQSTGYMSFDVTNGLNDQSDTITGVKKYFLKTTDGGITWATISNKSNVAFADFINTKAGYCLEDTSDNPGSTAYTLAKTINGGANWSSIRFGDGNIASLQAVGLNVLFATAGELPKGQDDVGSLKVYRSVNGGSGWVPIKTPPVYHRQGLSAMYWLSAAEGYVMCMEYTGQGNISPKTLYYTRNGGSTWSIRARSDDPTNGTKVAVGKMSGAGRGMGSMYFYSDGVGYYNSLSESIFKTSNRGSDFFSVNPHGNYGESISDFDMVNEHTGYAYINETDTLYRILNGGTNWQAVITPEKIASQLQ